MMIADLVAHLPEGVLQGAVCIAGTPFVDGAVLSAFDPIAAPLRAGISSTDALEARNAILAANRLLFMRSKGTPPNIIQDTAAAVAAGVDFVEENPRASWSLRVRMLGAALLSSNVHANLLATRVQDFSKVAERGAQGFPVQLILGSDDALVDERKMSEALMPVFKNLRIKVVEGGSHAPFVDSPGEVLGTISEFVKSL